MYYSFPQEGSSDISRTTTIKAHNEVKTSFFMNFKQELLKLGLNKESVDIFCSSWRQGTKNTYWPILSTWIEYAKQNGIQILKPTVEQGINFLAFLFYKDFSYNRLLLARSAISSFLFNNQFGNNPLVLAVTLVMLVVQPDM